MNEHDALIRALLAERFGTRVPPAPKQDPISRVALIELLRELDARDDDEELSA